MEPFHAKRGAVHRDSRARAQLEEALRGDPAARVLFVYAEEATPEFYAPHFGEPRPAMAEAVLLGGAES